jgi:tRNA(Arg) A34 adenosine deaminase TadA
MRRVIANTRKSRSPFFSALAKGSKIIAMSKSNGPNNPVEHAEMLTIKKALKKMKTNSLKRCTLYSTCESCPMCMGAIHWTGITEVVFGARLTDSRRFGFDEIMAPQLIKTLKSRGVKVNKDIMRKECLKLFDQ